MKNYELVKEDTKQSGKKEEKHQYLISIGFDGDFNEGSCNEGYMLRGMRQTMKGYKAFNSKLQCKNNFQFEVGKEYEVEGTLVICVNGFHFCKTIADCFEYYPKKEETRICEIEALGEIVEDDNKSCTSKIKIIRELTKEEHQNGNIGLNNEGYSNIGLSNKGNSNEGDCNRGDSNKGDSNKGFSNEGDFNKGDYNKGDCNKGNGNVGDYNKGEFNIGDYNIGNSNKGCGNIGDYNIGDYCIGDYNKGNCNIGIKNKGDYQIGICNTNAPLIIFNKVSKMTYKELIDSGALRDIQNGYLSDVVRAIDTFDIDVWNEIFKKRGQGYESNIWSGLP